MFRNLFWHKFPKVKPKENGWYQCTICFEFTEENNQVLYQDYVMDLFWYNESQKFVDNRIKHIFESYEVYGYGNKNERLKLSDHNMIDRTEHVIAWRKMPNTYREINKSYYKGGKE